MSNKKLLVKASDAGLEIFENENENLNDEISFEFQGVSRYKSNNAFYYLKFSSFEAVILKGIYKNFYRIISGFDDLLDSSDWSRLCKTINTLEDINLVDISIDFIIMQNKVFIKSISKIDEINSLDYNLKDKSVEKPYTATECEVSDRFYLEGKTILSNSFIDDYFPDTVSPLTASILEQNPDILYPLFISAGLKTVSPSVVNVFNTPYITLQNYEKSLNYIGINSYQFRLNYQTPLYLQSKSKTSKLKRSLFPDLIEEIGEILDELKHKSKSTNVLAIKDDFLFNVYIKIFIIHTFFVVELLSAFNDLFELTDDKNKLLKLIYKTRKENLFSKSKDLDVFMFFDFLSKKIKANSSIDNYELSDYDTLMKELKIKHSLFASKKIKMIVERIHKLLDMKDDFTITLSNLMGYMTTALERFFKNHLKPGFIESTDGFYYLDYDDVSKLFNGNYYGDLFNAISFKRNKYYRFSTLFKPKEIYVKDILTVNETNKYISNAILKNKIIDVLSLNDKDSSGIITTDLNLDSYKGMIIHFSKVSVFNLDRYKYAEGFMFDSIPLYSPIVEFAILNDIPMFSGVRYASGILDRKETVITSNKLKILD